MFIECVCVFCVRRAAAIVQHAHDAYAPTGKRINNRIQLHLYVVYASVENHPIYTCSHMRMGGCICKIHIHKNIVYEFSFVVLVNYISKCTPPPHTIAKCFNGRRWRRRSASSAYVKQFCYSKLNEIIIFKLHLADQL